MATGLTDLRVFQIAEQLAEMTWKMVERWPQFAKNTVGEQVVRSSDRVGATIAESFGRFHFGEKLQFLYYARGSLFETRFWLRQAFKRKLMTKAEADEFAKILEPLAIAINNLAGSLKEQKSEKSLKAERTLKESPVEYVVSTQSPNLLISNLIISSEEISWLTNLTNENAS